MGGVGVQELVAVLIVGAVLLGLLLVPVVGLVVLVKWLDKKNREVSVEQTTGGAEVSDGRKIIGGLLSLCCIVGLGQAIKGHMKKAATMFLVALVGGMTIPLGIGLLIVPVAWLWSVVDAFTADTDF